MYDTCTHARTPTHTSCTVLYIESVLCQYSMWLFKIDIILPRVSLLSVPSPVRGCPPQLHPLTT